MDFDTASQLGFEDAMASAEALYASGPARTRRIRVHGKENEPLIPAGSVAFVTYLSLDEVKTGQFVLVKTDRGPALRRLVRIRRDPLGRPVLYCRSLKSHRPPRPSTAEQYMGTVVEIEHAGKRSNPSAEGRLSRFINLLTDYGTTDPLSKLARFFTGR